MSKWLDRFSAKHEFDRHQFRSPSVGALLFVAVTVVLQMLVGIFVRWDAFAPPPWLEGVYDFLLHRNLQLICLSEKTWAFKDVENLYATAWVSVVIYAIPGSVFAINQVKHHPSPEKVTRKYLLWRCKLLAIMVVTIFPSLLVTSCIRDGGELMFRYQLPSAIIGQFFMTVVPVASFVMIGSFTVALLIRFRHLLRA